MWFVFLLSSPGIFYLAFGIFLLLWDSTGRGSGELVRGLRPLGLDEPYGYALGWGYVWGLVAPLPIGLSLFVYRRAELNDLSTQEQILTMRIAIAMSVASWFIFAGYWLAQT